MVKATANGVRLWGACTDEDLGIDEKAEGEASEASWGESLAPKYRRAMLIGFFIFMFQQMAGVKQLRNPNS